MILFTTIFSLLALYSYALMDPNITLFTNPLWTSFRNTMIELGYYHRDISSAFFVVLIIGLFVCNYIYTERYKSVNVMRLAIIAAIISIVSHPFLSHDFFNYLFDAKILTFYNQNPYFHKALDFPNDPWIRFMHWTIRTYPYGPSFLPITLVPSFLAFGKFILNVILFKAVFAALYVLAVHYLRKIDKKIAVFFATQPLIIVEGLVNSHNDIIAVSFGIIGIYYLINKSNSRAGILFLLSAGIKYITAPVLLVFEPFVLISHRKSKNLGIIAAFILLLTLILYISFTSEIQAWYFLNLFIFLPFFPELLMYFSVFFIGLLLSYYPFVHIGNWATETVNSKHYIMFVFFLLNLMYIFIAKKLSLKTLLTPKIAKGAVKR